ncbi:MAG: prepilin-type N-terminal cleavage/methylation domain-containing protein [Curvibacter sp.]|nr:MAG: prepilin-type N-terminal cleavage/methylation domain-containing protein [Curvibacter sp.]
MGAKPRQPGMRGVTLIELMVALAILGISLLMVIPAFSTWLRNAQVRSQAENLQSGLQMARAEAVRRNTPVRLQIISDLSNSCTLVSAGTQWVSNLGSDVSPASLCASALSDTSSPYLLQRSAGSNSSNNALITASQSTLAFDGLGRLTATTQPSTSASATVTFQISAPGGTCIAASGDTRCLNLVVSPGGQIRLCDPSLSSAQVADRARAC